MMKKKQPREKPAQKAARKAGIEEVREKLETQSRAIRKILKQLTSPIPESKKDPTDKPSIESSSKTTEQ